MDANKGSRKAYLLVSVVFILGIALGAVGAYLVSSRVLAEKAQPVPHGTASTIAKLNRELTLSADQQKQIETILNETRAKYDAVHERVDPENQKIRQEGRDRIRQVLTVDQRPKFEDVLKQIDEERRKQAAEQGK
jgi:hypothetical protein